jgi:hypothetical protein
VTVCGVTVSVTGAVTVSVTTVVVVEAWTGLAGGELIAAGDGWLEVVVLEPEEDGVLGGEDGGGLLACG